MIQKWLTILMTMLIFISCANESKTTGEVVEADSNGTQYKDTLINGFIPEMQVNSVELLNALSIEKLNQPIVVKSESKGGIFPYVTFVNASKTEILKLIFHHGSGENEFSEMELSSNPNGQEGILLEDIDHFQSGRGIKLGMTKAEVEKILGKANMPSPNKLRYRIVDVDLSDSDFLKKYNLPMYYIDAEFKDGILVGYKFGFDYP